MPTTEPMRGVIVGPRTAADLAAVVARERAVDRRRVGVVDAVMGRADERAAVHLPGELRQVLAEVHAGHARRDRLELAANLRRRVRLHVPHVEMVGPPFRKMTMHASACRGVIRRLIGAQDRGKIQPEVRRGPGLDHLPTGNTRARARGHREVPGVSGMAGMDIIGDSASRIKRATISSSPSELCEFGVWM